MIYPSNPPVPVLHWLHLDDDPSWRETVATALRSLGPVIELGEAPTGERGLAACRGRMPAVIVTELWWADFDGFAALEELVRLPGRPRVLALTHRCDEVALHRATERKLAGFIWKTPKAAAQLCAAVSALAAGRDFFPPEVLHERRRMCAASDAYFKVLTPTEQALLPWLGRGFSDTEIARETGQREATVRWHRGEIMRRLSLRRTTDLMMWATAKGFVRPHLPAPPCMVMA